MEAIIGGIPMQIHGFNKTTLLDYPEHLAATIFLGHCNFRCPFCHNASLVLAPEKQPTIPAVDVINTLKERQGILEGVCITGGEPTLTHDLPDFIAQIKDLGLKVKLDTNGSNPLMLSYLLDQHLLDYVAMDIKNSKEQYNKTIGLSSSCMDQVIESISLLKQSNLPYEFRTTIVSEFHRMDDILSIGEWLHGSPAYYLQKFIDSGNLLQNGLHAASRETMLAYKEALKPHFKVVELRGMD
ncbi:anaerobic ribonucleoside-triphosphate reductase activating protein [Anaerosporobacter faecicola]|uniref:anaerobic ribonucleoside-triphosphate reductase activating protein n=1 Tax=Anaerosporobacter faecicola TaxID=2718714 RepID=UPI001EE58CA4|nr:anaerobic ribonucleoside-triphosphate reductase activating protein [Anaerosporobacter faecicola]